MPSCVTTARPTRNCPVNGGRSECSAGGEVRKGSENESRGKRESQRASRSPAFGWRSERATQRSLTHPRGRRLRQPSQRSDGRPPCAYVKVDILVVSMKKTRLEAAGWKVGTAAEFLGLNKQEAAFVEMKLALARCLHALRIRRKLSQSRVAALVGSSQSRVAKMESGDPSVSVDLLLRSVLAIGGSPTEIVRALAARKKLTPA